MDQIESITQAYSQAPWRRQLQFIGLFSLLLVLIALIAGIYLNVSAKTATKGRSIQTMREEIDVLDREIEDLQSQLAVMLSSAVMENRAIALGYEPVLEDHTVFLEVPGYIRRQPVVLAPFSRRSVISAPVLPPEYTESLIAWLKKQLHQYEFSVPEVIP